MKRLRFQPASPYLVQLDLDDHASLKLFLKHIAWFSCIMHESGQELRGFSLSRSRSGNHHAEIRLSKPKSKIERICIAAILGSDRARELCNYERVQFKSTYPILFFKKQ